MKTKYFKEKDPITDEVVSYKILQDLPGLPFSTQFKLEEMTERIFFHEVVEQERKMKEEVEQVSIIEKDLPKKPTEFDDCFSFSPYQVYQLYYYYYAKWIWQLIHYRGCSYEWLSINEHEFNRDDVSQKSSTDWSESTTKNDYLQMYEHEQIELGRDIMKNGTYFPLIIGTDPNSDVIPVIFGKHRVYSLQLNPEETKDKEFLFIRFPHGYNFFYDFTSDKTADYQKNPIICNYTHPSFSYSVYEYECDKESLIFHEFLDISDDLPGRIFKYRNLINPNPIFNNKEAWEEFINNPFDEDKLLEIQEKWSY